MTDIEKKALALVNQVCRERRRTIWTNEDLNRRSFAPHEALCRAIEQHEAFRQEVSDAVEAALRCEANFQPYAAYAAVSMTDLKAHLSRFIIAKPDPLVEALAEATGQGENYIDERDAAALRAAIEKRGGKIVWGEKQ